MTFTEQELEVRRPDGSLICRLSRRIAERNGVDAERMARLHELHRRLDQVKTAMAATGSPLQLRTLAAEAEAIEFDQQEAWGFPRDARHHNWFMLPGCSCPKMDNRDSLGTDMRIFDSACPVHGDLPLTQADEVLSGIGGTGAARLLAALTLAAERLSGALPPATVARLAAEVARLYPKDPRRRALYDAALRGVLAERLFGHPPVEGPDDAARAAGIILKKLLDEACP